MTFNQQCVNTLRAQLSRAQCKSWDVNVDNCSLFCHGTRIAYSYAGAERTRGTFELEGSLQCSQKHLSLLLSLEIFLFWFAEASAAYFIVKLQVEYEPQVHCKYETLRLVQCQNGWFTISISQLTGLRRFIWRKSVTFQWGMNNRKMAAVLKSAITTGYWVLILLFHETPLHILRERKRESRGAVCH